MEQISARWEIIEEYPDYEASDTGEIRNRHTGIARNYDVGISTVHSVCKGGV